MTRLVLCAWLIHNPTHALSCIFCSYILIKHNSSEQSSSNQLYWDHGPKAIVCFLGHHLKECANNVICNALSLTTVEFEDNDSNESSTSKHFKSVSPRKLSSHSQDSAKTVAHNPLCIGAYFLVMFQTSNLRLLKDGTRVMMGDGYTC